MSPVARVTSLTLLSPAVVAASARRDRGGEGVHCRLRRWRLLRRDGLSHSSSSSTSNLYPSSPPPAPPCAPPSLLPHPLTPFPPPLPSAPVSSLSPPPPSSASMCKRRRPGRMTHPSHTPFCCRPLRFLLVPVSVPGKFRSRRKCRHRRRRSGNDTITTESDFATC